MKSLTYLYILFVVFLACNAPSKQTIGGQTYTNKELGWAIEIPYGFKSLRDDSLTENREKGKKIVEQSAKQKVDLKGLSQLVNFQRDAFNSFNATMKKFEAEKDGDYFQSLQTMKKAIYDVYTTSQKLKVDTSSFTNSFGGQTFNGFLVKIYAPNGEVLMHQLVLSTLRKGYDFAITVNYNNENDGKLIMDALKNSKFSE